MEKSYVPLFDSLKKRSRNEQFLKKHCKDLILQYDEYIKNIRSIDLTPEIFYNFSYKESFLSHLSTGYPNIYYLLVNYILLKKEIDSQPMHESVWREKTKQATALGLEYKHGFGLVFLKIIRGSEEFEGMCEQCKIWYNENDPKSKELILRLQDFKMPF